MIRFAWERVRLGWLVPAFAALVVASGLALAPPALAQEPAQPAAAPSAEVAEDTEEEREVRRLPRYYAAVVAPYQREKIYDIQAKYEEQIRALQQQIKALLAKRDAEIETVLVPEQREILKKIKEEAAQRARALAAQRKKEDRPAEEPSPPTAPTPEPKESAASEGN